VLIISFVSSPAYSFDTSKKVSQIVIVGNERVQEPTIRYYISLKEKEPYSATKVSSDIHSIFSLGSFDDIRVDVTDGVDGLVVTYIVKEKPFIVGVSFKGVEINRKKDIREMIELKEGNFLKPGQALRDKAKIRQFYKDKGYYSANVDIVEKDRGHNQIELEYEIAEGKKAYVSNIIFEGNKHFSDRKLSKNINTKEKGFFSFLTDSGLFRKDLLETDVQNIETIYKNDGFIKVKVQEPRVDIDESMGTISISFFIDEGEQYRLGDIGIEEDELFTEKTLRDTLKIKSGDVFNRAEFSKGIFDITNLYLEKGYAYTDVIQQTKVDDEAKTVAVDLKVARGEKVYIGNINIFGNKKTVDKVIRREIRFKEGELFDISKLVLSRDRLNRLGYFSKVDIKQKGREEDDLVDLDIDLEETYTGTFSISAGYSDLEGALFATSITQRNLFGEGQTLNLRAEFSSMKRDYTLSFYEPYLFDKNLSAGFSIFNTQTEYTSYDIAENGGDISLGKSVGEYGRIGLQYQYKQSDTIVKDEANASTKVLASSGNWKFHELTNSYSFDSKDDFYNPTKGATVKIKGTYGMGEGPTGEVDYYRLDYNSAHYYSIFWNLITKIGGRIGYTDTIDGGDLPIFKNYYLGGASSLRGFNYENVGPRDENGDSIGGRALLLLNAELQYPFNKSIRGLIFYDRGQLYGEDALTPSRTTEDRYDIANMRSSWGTGVSILSPIGPISLVWGFKLDPIEKEEAVEFHFNMGGSF